MDENRQLLRYIGVGTLNTLFGYGLILGLQAVIKNPFAANSLGYAVSALASFMAHSRYSFQANLSLKNFIPYLFVLFGSYLLNLLALTVALAFTASIAAQITAVTIFAICNYYGQKFLVFKR